MNQIIFKELSIDFDHGIKNLLNDARGTLKTLKNLSELMVAEIDRSGNLVSITPMHNEISHYLHKLMFISGKIEAMRHFSASMDTVLNCMDEQGTKPYIKMKFVD